MTLQLTSAFTFHWNSFRTSFPLTLTAHLIIYTSTQFNFSTFTPTFFKFIWLIKSFQHFYLNWHFCLYSALTQTVTSFSFNAILEHLFHLIVFSTLTKWNDFSNPFSIFTWTNTSASTDFYLHKLNSLNLIHHLNFQHYSGLSF